MNRIRVVVSIITQRTQNRHHRDAAAATAAKEATALISRQNRISHQSSIGRRNSRRIRRLGRVPESCGTISVIRRTAS